MMKCEWCEEKAETKWQWPSDENGLPRELCLCGSCSSQRWNWLSANSNGTNMYQAVILSSLNIG